MSRNSALRLSANIFRRFIYARYSRAKAAGNDVEKITLKGKVFAGGVNDAGEIANHPALKQAYELGLKA